MNLFKKVTLVIYVIGFSGESLFALDIVHSDNKAMIVIGSAMIFKIALILDSIYNTK